jgi:hypothetical protein
MQETLISRNLRQLREAFALGYIVDVHIQEVSANSKSAVGVHYELRYSMLSRPEAFVVSPFGKNTPREFRLAAAVEHAREFSVSNGVLVRYDTISSV